MNTRKLHVLVVVCSITLLAPGLCSAQAQLFKVGPAGDYATIDDALVDLLASPLAVNLIKVQAGVTTLEHLSIPATWTTGTIWLSGGWNSFFLQQSGDPSDTVISGWTSSRIIDVSIAGGTLIISDLSIQDGAAGDGAGLRINPTNDSSVRLDNLRISNNTASGTGTVNGGGIRAILNGATSLDIAGCEVLGNQAAGLGAAAEAFGAGIEIESHGSSEFSITNSSIHHNTASSDIQVGGAGIFLHLDENSIGTIADCIVDTNSASSTVSISVSGTGLRATTSGSAQLTVARSRIFSNTVAVAGIHDQAFLSFGGDSIVSISDSIVADGPSNGLYLRASDQSTVYATHLTVATNGNNGLQLNRSSSGTADLYLSNTISANNDGSDLTVSGSVTQTANIIGIDPEFVDPGDLDFRVEIGSVAEDAGVPAPPGGLGAADIRGGLRVLGSAPDAGAYEGNVAMLFSDGFELRGALRWSETVD